MIAFRKARGIRAALALLVVAVSTSDARANLFNSDDLVVTAYGLTPTASGAPTAISLIEYSTSGGAPILTDTLPTADGVGGSSNFGVVGEYGSSSEGNIQLSGNGLYLTFGGYSATAAAKGIRASTNSANGTHFAVGTPFEKSNLSLAQASDTDVPRVAILVDALGNVSSSTVLNDLYNTNNVRSVYSATGSTLYLSGQGDGSTSDQGIFLTPTGTNTVTHPGTSPTKIFNAISTRFSTVFQNNTYFSTDISTSGDTGIWKITGTPTQAATPAKIIPGTNGKSGSSEVFYSPEGFYFANASTLYVADTGDPKAGSKGDGGIQKWTLNGSTWSLQYTLTPSSTGTDWVPAGNPKDVSNGESGFEAITGKVVGTGPSATVDLFAVSYTLGDDNPDGLYAIDDTLNATTIGSQETFTELESGAGNGGLVFKGVSFAPVPEPTTLLLPCVIGMLLTRRRRPLA